ncbi:MAG: SIS domain-containing protein [Hyphomicrobiales bacterium]
MAILDFIGAQPAVVEAVSLAMPQLLRNWSPPSVERLSLVGAGTSLHALMAIAPSFASTLRVPVECLSPNRFISGARPEKPAGRLVIILSQSGASATSVDAASHSATMGAATLVLTGEPASPIAAVKGAEIVVMPIGPEPIGPKTKGYTASLAALVALDRHLGNAPSPTGAIHLDTKAVEAARQAAMRIAPSLDEADYILVAGTGRHAATALEASLKISEIAGLPSGGFETEEALHGRLHALDRKRPALLIAADSGELDLAVKACRVMAEHHTRLRIVNLTAKATEFDWMQLHDPLPPPLDTISAILPFQWLAVQLAIRRALDPDMMRYPHLSAALAIKIAR